MEATDRSTERATLDNKWAEIDAATRRVAVLQKRIDRRIQASMLDEAEIQKIKSQLGVT